MNSKSATDSTGQKRKRLRLAIKQGLRSLNIQLSLLSHHVGTRVDLRDVDLDCLDLMARHGPLSPSALARLAGLHPATITGILDRLEKSAWVTRQTDDKDRRAVVIHPSRNRGAELVKLYAGMNHAMDKLCASYGDSELEVIADFLERTAQAGQSASEALAEA